MSRKIVDIIYKKRCETTTYYYTGIVSIITYVKQIVITDRKFLGIFPLKDKVIFKIEQICPYVIIRGSIDPILQNVMQEQYQLAKLHLLESNKIEI